MTPPVRKLAYTVRAEHPDRPSADRYLAWLLNGHVQGVMAGGAGSAVAVDLDAETPTIEVRYVFPSRAAFDRYLQESAPRLRAEGLAEFGPDSGVRFSRSTGEIHGPSTGV